MIDFFVRSQLHGLAGGIVVRGGGLAGIERLGADLTGVINAHRARYMTAVVLVQVGGSQIPGRVFTKWHRRVTG